jgi:hypothetical protein
MRLEVPSSFRENVIRFLPQHFAGAQYGFRETLLIDRIGPDLRFEAKARKGLVMVAVQPFHFSGDIDLETCIDLDAGFGRCDFKTNARMWAEEMCHLALGDLFIRKTKVVIEKNLGVALKLRDWF